jgi:hypothetical protein
MFVNWFQKTNGWSFVYSAIITGVVVMTITLIAAYFTEETFHKDLDYLETEELYP